MTFRPGTLTHYGTKQHSGRYPWGSGEDPEQRETSFLGQVQSMKKKGMSDSEIAKGMGMKTLELRAKRTIAISEQKKAEYNRAITLKEKGYSYTEIGRQLGRNESSIRSLLDPYRKERADKLNVITTVLKDSVEEKDFIDVGVGVERHLGVSRTKLQAAVAALKEEGYTVHYIKVPQLMTNHDTSTMVLAKPGVHTRDVYANMDKIRLITDKKIVDHGNEVVYVRPPQNISSDRIHINYDDDGGSQKDGVIEIRRGVSDLSLGNARYAQVRIAVDGTHFLKGMAMYSDDMPPGKDIIYNTNKSKDTPAKKVFKEMKLDSEGNVDKDNPFGAVIKAGGQKGALNIINEEGDWGEWSKTISSQMLSKQRDSLAERQLGLAYKAKKEELDEILSLTNPVVKRKMLDDFAESCDSDAVHLKAAALPRQGTHVILPLPGMKENEIYAPNYENGEHVVLIRHPHGGIFEIPELVVNNNHPGAKRVMDRAKDAVGINAKVAERLSGADFDGDTVLVIPNNQGLVKTSAPLKDLANFDPKSKYKLPESAPKMTPKAKQKQMGDASNLITDMTIKGANQEEIARAVRHSMVVIDAEKHHLNYKQSFIDNGIASLKVKYQGRHNGGASTLISRASSEKRVADRKEGMVITDPVTGKTKRLYVDPVTGKKLYTNTDAAYTITKQLKNGEVRTKVIPKTVMSTKMAEEDDAFKLSSGTTMEAVYATHANKLKAMGNESRKTLVTIKSPAYSPSAKEAYKTEVATLQSKLNIALKHAPLERQAQILANAEVAAKKADNPSMEKDELKKVKRIALAKARARMGDKKTLVEITDREWEAIQAGAVSANTLSKILDNSDPERVKSLATPRQSTSLSPAKLARAKALLASGHTQADIANVLGVSTKTISKLL